MAMNFAGGSDAGSTDLLPQGMLAWVYLTVRGLKMGVNPNKETGKLGRYLDCEFTIAENQPFERRKIWANIMDPNWPDNSKGAIDMGMTAVKRILEAGRWLPNLGPFDLARFNQGGYLLGDYPELNGLKVAVKIKVEKGTGGYNDKNTIAEFLSPNPASDSFKAYQDLLAGNYRLPAGQGGQAPQQGGLQFGGAPAQTGGAAPFGQASQPSSTAGFAAQPAQQQTGAGFAAPAQTGSTGFQQPQTQTMAPAPAPSTPAAGAMGASPSEPAKPAWLTQAGGA